jgi:hypothetical protein
VLEFAVITTSSNDAVAAAPHPANRSSPCMSDARSC